jgi:pimeloyl-ACP methyl ester carboxylesterase
MIVNKVRAGVRRWAGGERERHASRTCIPLGCGVTVRIAFVVALALSMTLTVEGQGGDVIRVFVNGVELHYTEQGTGEPVVLLHGGQGDYRSWQPQMNALSSRYRVISYSRRYHYPNENPMTATDHSALIDAEDLAALVAELELGRVHLVGTSYGAFTALAYAVAHPGLVRSMVLAEPPVLQWVTDSSQGKASRTPASPGRCGGRAPPARRPPDSRGLWPVVQCPCKIEIRF